ncbi:uncharacterized protein LOC113208980 isoform X1 [Frankliniella occidentalis]|uniref:Uncharacterized protein LOC113208980 isoform X1 n=1 Tax=Frankliniella occidentalis TaxID=133901 RepID=A0A6J1SRV4_FRAOC|nr:uncharacterized protein LOC113208980 isoform X1 [Frankliniella occidentalis]
MSKIPYFGVIVPSRHVEEPYSEESGPENVFFSKIYDAQYVQEIIVFLPGVLPAEFGAEVFMRWQYDAEMNAEMHSEMNWISLGYISNDKPSDIFKVNFFKTASFLGAGDGQNSPSLPNLDILLKITVEPLTELLRKVQEQEKQVQEQEEVAFFDTFNSLIPPKYIFKKIPDLPLHTPIKILKVEVVPDSKGKFFAMLGKDEIYFNLPIDDHKNMLRTNGYEIITNLINKSKNPFCFVYLRKTVRTFGILQYNHSHNIAEKAERKQQLTYHEIPPAILKEADTEVLGNDMSQARIGN